MNTVSANSLSYGWARMVNEFQLFVWCMFDVWWLTLVLLHRPHARIFGQNIWSDIGNMIMSMIMVLMYVHKWLLLFKVRFTAVFSVVALASWVQIQPCCFQNQRFQLIQAKHFTALFQSRRYKMSYRLDFCVENQESLTSACERVFSLPLIANAWLMQMYSQKNAWCAPFSSPLLGGCIAQLKWWEPFQCFTRRCIKMVSIGELGISTLPCP